MSSDGNTGDASKEIAEGTAGLEETKAKLLAEKVELQKLFNMGNFPAVVQKTEDALKWAKKLPSPLCVPEIVQLYVNASSALLQMNKLEDAERFASTAILHAEMGATERPNQPQLLEVLSVALGAKVISLVAAGKAEPALELAEKSLAISEAIYPKNDPRIHKSLRNIGLCLEKKGDTASAEKAFLRAHTTLMVTIGPATPETQLLVEDMINLHMRKADLDKAEAVARKNHKALTDKGVGGREVAFLADASTRLATILVRKNQHAEAEPLVRESLSIREKMPNAHPLTIAFSLVQLAGVLETQDKLDMDVELMLKRALDIFGRVKGPNCPEVQNTLGQLRNVHSKLASSGKLSGTGDDDDEGLQYRVTSESKGSPKASVPKGNDGSITADDRRLMSQLAPGDPAGRMELAGKFYEMGHFNSAEELLVEAHALFLRANGAEHQTTAAAQQNLAVVRNNRIQQLWMEVVADEVSRAAGKDSRKDDADTPVVSAEGRELELEERLMLGVGTDMEEQSRGCSIC